MAKSSKKRPCIEVWQTGWINMLQLNATLSHQINDLINAGPNYIKYHLKTFRQIISVVAKLALSILIAFPSRINIHSQPYLHWIINFNLFVYFLCSTKTLQTERCTWWTGVHSATNLGFYFELIINIFTAVTFEEEYSDILEGPQRMSTDCESLEVEANDLLVWRSEGRTLLFAMLDLQCWTCDVNTLCYQDKALYKSQTRTDMS